MDYKAMFEAVESKLEAELAIYKKMSNEQTTEEPWPFVCSNIASRKDILKFMEELRRIYAQTK